MPKRRRKSTRSRNTNIFGRTPAQQAAWEKNQEDAYWRQIQKKLDRKFFGGLK